MWGLRMGGGGRWTLRASGGVPQIDMANGGLKALLFWRMSSIWGGKLKVHVDSTYK